MSSQRSAWTLSITDWTFLHCLQLERCSQTSRVCFVSGASSRTIPGQNRGPAENVRLARTVSQVLAAEPGPEPPRPPTPTGESSHWRPPQCLSVTHHALYDVMIAGVSTLLGTVLLVAPPRLTIVAGWPGAARGAASSSTIISPALSSSATVELPVRQSLRIAERRRRLTGNWILMNSKSLTAPGDEIPAGDSGDRTAPHEPGGWVGGFHNHSPAGPGVR
eukprot:601880-Hanusia_phi.AAC.1